MNVYDSRRMADVLIPLGYSYTDDPKKAEVVILNTCHIREKATEKVYSDIGRLKKDFRNKEKPLVIVAGCVAQAESDEMLKREPYIDILIGPQSYHKINDIILSFLREKNKLNFTEFDVLNKFDKLENFQNKQNSI